MGRSQFFSGAFASAVLFLSATLSGVTARGSQFDWWDYTGEGNSNNIMDPNNWRWCNYTDYPYAGNTALDPNNTGYGYASSADFTTTTNAGDTMVGTDRYMLEGPYTLNIPTGSTAYFQYNGTEIDGGITINVNGGLLSINGTISPNGVWTNPLQMNNRYAKTDTGPTVNAAGQTENYNGTAYYSALSDMVLSSQG